MPERIRSVAYLCFMAKKKKLPTDVNQRAKSILDMVTDESEDTKTDEDLVKAAAGILGRKGGLKGGNARAAALSPKKRSDIAKKAAAARWNKK